MNTRKLQSLLAATAGLFSVSVLSTQADEGMWLYNDLPKAQIQQKYGVTLSDAWTAHLLRSSVKVVGEASGEFVSADGLVMTNHHVGAETLQKLSTAQHNYARDGFYARTPAEELKAPDLEMDVLQAITPVTGKVNAAVTPQMTPAEALLARRARAAAIETEASAKTGLKNEIVTLFGGARYDLYTYKTYSDIRLVMAPDANAAAFGGDPDNFEYPRYDLDVCFFRVYENGRPAKIADYLTWSKTGVKAGEPVFVSGNPARTRRLDTVADLSYARDVGLPSALNNVCRREVSLTSWSKRLPENARVADESLLNVQNTRKDLTGILAALQDPTVFAQKQAREAALRASVAANPTLEAADGNAWNEVEKADAVRRARAAQYGSLADSFGLQSHLYGVAQTLLLMAEEDQKPNGKRLPQFRASRRAALEDDLFSAAPVYPGLERLNLTESLSQMAAILGEDNPLVVQVLAGHSPAERAAELVAGTMLADAAARKRLAAGGLPAVQSSQDPMIAVARLLEPTFRALQKQNEEKIAGVDQAAYAEIAQAQLAASGGQPVYPDATFTLRLSYGTVAGYMQAGQAIPAFTTLGGLYPYAALHDNLPPYQLSPLWAQAKDKLDPQTPFNFVCTADIIGGNSGSPVVDKNGELVGIIFDSNIQGLGAEYRYSDTQARAVAVASQAIVETLRHVYGDDALANELLSGHAHESHAGF